MNRGQRGSIIAGTWLIGLGVVFLVRQISDLSWSDAWPLFVILVGVASLVQTALAWRPSIPGLWAFTWPVLWIVIGGVLLLSTTGLLGTGPGDLISQGWPWLLVAVGVWFLIGAVAPGSSGPTERLSIALRGAPDASVKIRFGAGTLTTHPAPSGVLVDGTFEGGVVSREQGPGRVELEQDTSYGLPWLDRRSAWDVGLPADVPLALRAETGAARAMLDLRDIRLRRLDLQTGASETRVILPRNAGFSEVRAEHGAAVTHLRGPGRRRGTDPHPDGDRQQPDRRDAVPPGRRRVPVSRLRHRDRSDRPRRPGRRRLAARDQRELTRVGSCRGATAPQPRAPASAHADPNRDLVGPATGPTGTPHRL